MATLSFSLLLSKPTLNPTTTIATCRLRPQSVFLSRPWNRGKTVTMGGTRVAVARGMGSAEGRRNSGGGRGGEEEERERETIMLPGCDYNHWLIVMEFPKDPAPTREQMIDTYLDTLQTVLGSMEEAKRNMYAFSTTTYTGFQCTVSEETSEKFKGLPGVLWVLPDSYIDVKNKDYGGDKYINGEIIPCKYPTYQPKQSRSKYESKKYVRQRDGPAAADRRKPKQEATPSESTTA